MRTQKLILPLIFCLLTTYLIPHNSPGNTTNKIEAFSKTGLNILSYNMWGLPIWLPKVGINNRFQNAVDDLAENNFDVIFLQECFSKRLRKKLLNKLQSSFYSTMDYTCNQNFLLGLTRDCHGGLITFSKLPIVEEFFYPFPLNNRMKNTEKIGKKGFIITRVLNQESDTINLINTHLYAGPKDVDEQHRLLQISYMDSVLRVDGIYRNTCILGGDLNIDHPSVSLKNSKSPSLVYKYIIKTMLFEDSAPELGEEDFTVDSSRNFYCSSKNGKQKLDYIMIYQPKNKIKWSVEEAQSKYAFAKSFSDHLAWQVRYNYN